ncbi:MAG: ImmA/IrrE family metallo-endopeptidase [Candidatus Moraniibacteriota bacterium]
MRDIVIEKRASQVLNNFSIKQPPILLDKILSVYNITLGEAPSDEYSGFLIRKNGSALIGINSNDTFARQRFTIAHELAHFLLEKTKDTFVDEHSKINHRSYSHENGKERNEVMADKFAASLLMPRNFLKRDFMRIEIKGIFQENDLEYLAEKYVVSKEAMKYRLVNLGLIKL